MRLAARTQSTLPALLPDRADADQVLAKVSAWQWGGDPSLSNVDVDPSSYAVPKLLNDPLYAGRVLVGLDHSAI